MPEHDVEYANVAIRGRLVRQIVDEQLPVALAAQPDLVSLVGGGNDLLRPGGDPDELAAVLEDALAKLRAAGADLLLATGTDTRLTPLLRRIRGRVAIFNANIWSIAPRHDAVVLDQWGAAWLRDWRLWDTDRSTAAPRSGPYRWRCPASRSRSPSRTPGQSSAVMLNSTVSRTVPSSRRW